MKAHGVWIASLTLLVIAGAVVAQPAKPAAPAPTAEPTTAKPPIGVEATKFERFGTATGKLRQKEIYELGPIPNSFGTAEAKFVRLTEMRGGTSSRALVLTYKSQEKYSHEARSVVDEEELPGLASALQYMKANAANVVQKADAYTEITYSSVGAFETGFYVDLKKKSPRYYLKIGTETAFIDSPDSIIAIVDLAIAKCAALPGK